MASRCTRCGCVGCVCGGPNDLMSKDASKATAEDWEEVNKIIKETTKETNPKDAVGIKKVPFSTVSCAVIAELSLAMQEGARKYGRHNYRISGIRASVYYDACLRHLFKWWEGEDEDPDSGLNHVVKAFACLMVLRDAMICDKWTDDRPPSIPEGFLEGLNQKAAALIEKYPDALPAFVKSDTVVVPECPLCRALVCRCQ